LYLSEVSFHKDQPMDSTIFASRAFKFLTIAVICNYVFLLFTQFKIAVLSILIAIITGIVALYFTGSLLYLSIPYMLLPFIALTVRGIWGEQLTHTTGLWIEPFIFFIALGLYGIEYAHNNLDPDVIGYFPLVYFAVNGLMLGNIFIDGLKIKNRAGQKTGFATGEPAPAFCLQNENDEKVCLNDFKDKHNILLVFVRGEWCPMCHIMLRAYMKESAQFREKNVFLLVIGPDPTGVNKKMALDLKLDFHILSDPGLKVTHDYRLKIKASHLLQAETYNEEKEIPLPASFLIDKAGVIRYCSNPAKIGEVIKLPDIFPVLQSLDKTPVSAL
jgi:peroxiredoxin